MSRLVEIDGQENADPCLSGPWRDGDNPSPPTAWLVPGRRHPAIINFARAAGSVSIG